MLLGMYPTSVMPGKDCGGYVYYNNKPTLL